MIVQYLVRYTFYLLMFALTVICMGSGLYYLAEIVEEYTVLTKKIIKYTTFIVIGIHVLILIWEDTFPWTYILTGILAHIAYLLLLKDFPFIELTNPFFILAAVAVLADHCLWFMYFNMNYMEFEEVIAFFTICVWLVPFLYFISLSANENTLPYGIISSSGEEVTTEDFTYPLGSRKRGKRASRFLVLLNFLKRKKDSLFPSSNRNQKLF